MVNETTISMRELELESAQLLPSRETLCVTQMQWFPHGFHRGFFGFDRGFDRGFFGAPVGFGFPVGYGYGYGGYGCGCGCW